MDDIEYHFLSTLFLLKSIFSIFLQVLFLFTLFYHICSSLMIPCSIVLEILLFLVDVDLHMIMDIRVHNIILLLPMQVDKDT